MDSSLGDRSARDADSMCAVTAHAAVTGVSVSPPSPTINQAATVTVTGQNPCGAVEIDFGDGAKTTYPLQAPGLPFSVPHTWTTTGPKTIAAKGQGNCTGQVNASIQVKSAISLGDLCKVLDCGALFKPSITSVFGFATPGGTLAVIGKNFGTKPGTVVATLKTWNGADLKKTLSVLEWKNTTIGVDWPADITGVKQQNATIEVTTAGNSKSDPRTLTFFPADDFKILPAADVKVIFCGTDGNTDSCNGQQDPDDEGGFSPVASDSFDGWHFNTWGAIGDDTDTDKFQIALKNGWVMQSFAWDVSVDPGEGWANKPTGFSQSANWSPSVKWLVTPNDTVAYVGTVTIVGPVGVPYKYNRNEINRRKEPGHGEPQDSRDDRFSGIPDAERGRSYERTRQSRHRAFARRPSDEAAAATARHADRRAARAHGHAVRAEQRLDDAEAGRVRGHHRP